MKEKNTIAADKKCEKILTNYLKIQKHVEIEHTNYWLYENEVFDQLLSKLWFEVKTCEGEDYHVSSLRHLRYSLKRCLKKYRPGTDIMTDPVFSTKSRSI